MLGKTNITTLQDGAIIEDIANYGWILQSVSITGNFKKTLVENGYLVGATANGEIVYTKDGEIWKRLTLSQNSVKINDIEWDGSRFIFVGSHVLDGQETPLIATTVDFSTYKTIDMMDFLPESTYAKDKVYQIFSIYHENGNYIIFASGGDNSTDGRRLTLFYGDLKTSLKLVEKKESSGTKLKEESILSAKNSSKTIIFMEGNYESGYSGSYFYTFQGSSSGMKIVNSGDAPLTLFNAKDRLYYTSLHSNHELVKLSDTNEKIVMTTGINWEFVDGVYFNECDLFINAHNMLIVKKGEKITDKTLDDLIEIAPEKTMTCIEKAFGRLFIFGNSGLILKSTNEGNSSEGVLVQHLSAKQALEESKAYTDSKSFMTLANNLATTVPGSALDAVQGKVLYDRQNNLNVARKTGKQYNTLEEFVADTATEIIVPNIGRFKDLGGFVRGNVDWYRYVIAYQNPYVAGSASNISGNGILWDGSGNAYKLYIKGNKDSGITLNIDKVITEIELNNGLTSIKVYSNTDFQTVADSVPINKKLTCRMLASGNSPVTGLPLNQLFIVEIYAISEATVIATAYAAESGNMYVNRKSSGNWQGWEKKTNTVS